MENKSINGSRGWTILLSSVVAALMGSGSGVYVYMHEVGPKQLQEMARPDPATGTELRQLKREIQYHLNNHPDIINRFDRRITRLETQLEIILSNQDRILERLDAK